MPTSPTIESLYDCHSQSLFGFLMSLTQAESDARDLLQAVFVKLVREPELLAGVENPRAYLLRTAHRLFLDSIRRADARGRRDRAYCLEADEFFEPSEDFDTQIRTEEIAAALGELPEEQRAVVHLKIWEGLTFEAIGRALDVPQNTAVSRYRYALGKLRSRLTRTLSLFA